MVNYKLGKIYKIVSPSHPVVPPYFGSTCDALSRRLSGHRTSFKLGGNTTSKALMCFDDAIILLVEEFPCDNKEQLHAREGQIMLESLKRTNHVIAGSSSIEYQDYNRRRIKAVCAKYHEEHKEEIKEHHAKYYQEHKIELNELASKYYQEHKEEIKKYNAQYQQNHKEEISLKRAIKITCECGSIYAKADKSRHEKTAKHLKNLSKE